MYSNDPVIARKLQKIGEEFNIPGPFFAYEEIKMGNVNQTYKVSYIRDDGSGSQPSSLWIFVGSIA